MKKATKLLSLLVVFALAVAMIGCDNGSKPTLEYLFTGTVTMTSNEGVTLDAKGNDVSWSVTGCDNGDNDVNNDLATYDGTGKATVSAAGLVTPLVEKGKVRVFGTLKSDSYRYGYYDVSWDFTSSEGGEQGGEEPEIPPAAYNYAGPDSWNFVSQSADLAWAKAATGVAGGTDAAQSDGITFTNNADIEIAGAGNVSKLVLTGGTYIAYNDQNLGLRVYNKDGSPEAALKMTGLTGKLKVSVDWYSLKADGRTLTLKVGNTTKVGTAADGATVAGTGTRGDSVFTQAAISDTFDIGETPVDLTISVSKHLFIKSITIEDAAGATEKFVTIKVPSFETGIANTTDAVYSIGYDESITADGLIAKMNADENMAAAYTAIVSMYQAGVNAALTAAGLSEGEVTVTKDHIAFYFFANTEDWTAFDNADDDDAEAIAAAVAKAVTTINAGESVYIDFGMTDALRTAVGAAIASIGKTEGTVSYFTESTASLAATNSASTVIIGGDVSFGFDVEGFSLGTPEANTAQVNKIDFGGIKVPCNGINESSSGAKDASLTVAKDSIIGWATFTVTAKSAVKITKISATTGQTQSGNIGTAIYVNDTLVNTPAGNKVSVVSDLELTTPVTLAADETATIKVAIYAVKEWKKEGQSSIKCDMYFENINITAETL